MRELWLLTHRPLRVRLLYLLLVVSLAALVVVAVSAESGQQSTCPAGQIVRSGWIALQLLTHPPPLHAANSAG